MTATDELRECIRTANRSYEDARNPYNDREILHIPEEELLAIADRIDVEHKKAVERARMDGMDETFGNGWVKLPVDADGVPIHVGDTVADIDCPDGPHLVDGLRLDGMTWRICMDNFMLVPSKCRHVKPDSWERIIEDAANLVRGDNESVVELVERCRRLAGEA